MLLLSSTSGLVQWPFEEDEDVGFGYAAKQGFVCHELLLNKEVYLNLIVVFYLTYKTTYLVHHYQVPEIA